MRKKIISETVIGETIVCDICNTEITEENIGKHMDPNNCQTGENIDICITCLPMLPQKMINDPRLCKTEMMGFIIDCLSIWMENVKALPSVKPIDVNIGIISIWCNGIYRYFRKHDSMNGFVWYLNDPEEDDDEDFVELIVDGMPQGAKIRRVVELDKIWWF